MASATTSSAAAGDKLSVAVVLTADVGANSTVANIVTEINTPSVLLVPTSLRL